jgi:hypothetical protein
MWISGGGIGFLISFNVALIKIKDGSPRMVSGRR